MSANVTDPRFLNAAAEGPRPSLAHFARELGRRASCSLLTAEVPAALCCFTVRRAAAETVGELLLESPLCHFKPLALALSLLTFGLRGGILARRSACS